MKSFDEIWEFTDTIPGSFLRASGEQLYKFACEVPEGGWIVEVGVDQGRSASLLLEAAQEQSRSVFLIDKWESILVDNYWKVMNLAKQYPSVNYAVVQLSSLEGAAAFEYQNPTIDLIHIDAHHYDDVPDGGPELDCAAWLPKLKSGGVACFHDYGDGSTFPDVKRAVDKHTSGWIDLGVFDSLAVRRKP